MVNVTIVFFKKSYLLNCYLTYFPSQELGGVLGTVLTMDIIWEETVKFYSWF